jgi:hypothetical protein
VSGHSSDLSSSHQQTTFGAKIIFGLRWLAVIPGAFFAGVLATFPLHFALYYALTEFIDPYPQLPERILTPAVIAGTIVWAGAKIAPTRKLETAIVLFGLWTLLIGGLLAIALFHVKIGDRFVGLDYGGLGSASAFIGGVVGLLVVRNEEKESGINGFDVPASLPQPYPAEDSREIKNKNAKPIDWRKVAFGPEDVTHGAMLIRRGISDYQSWSEEMVRKYGESIRERLSKIYSEAEIQAAAADAMQEESRQLLGPSVWRPLEDAAWVSNTVKKDAMLELETAYNDLKTWNPMRLRLTVEAIAIYTVKEILGAIEQLPKQVRDQCLNVNNTNEALAAAHAAQSAAYNCIGSAAPGHPFLEIARVAGQMSYAAMEAAWGAIKAAWALHESALAAAKTADVAKKCGADPDDVLRQACGIWITAAKWSERYVQQSSKIQEIIGEGPERIGPAIDACCEDPNQKGFAQALLDAALEDYFLLQLAMFANKKVNVYVTINKWKNAGLKLPPEGTPEFYSY